VSDLDQRELREQRATRAAGTAFFFAILSGVALVVVYTIGGNTPLEGLFLGLGFLGIAVGLTIWVKAIIDEPEVVAERPAMRSADEEVASFRDAYDDAIGAAAQGDPSRRRFLVRLLLGAAASMGFALLLPFRSLGEPPGVSLFETPWQAGSRLVSFDGQPIRPDDLVIGTVVTVFPEDAIGDGDAQTLLIRLDEDRFELPAENPPPIEGGVVAFSKICTHAGCPVGLFRAAAGELFCPCHQSKFDVFRGAEPVGGPTTRPLPQLEIDVNDEGYLIATGDYPEPVGPAFWNMYRERD
jgi:ubiquinol-cytochrome c reductase iron-sulfur subunit